ncbi:MAG: RagB/SusD family nutrient uptake outer membrane protein [Parafilimonas sp.]|nr:RagB/SusD family nutrient uptake outer membrane protein [Parafilimonas sp.]
MKNLKYIIILTILFFSCNKKLDVSPSDSVPEGSVFADNASIQKALIGAYDVMTGDYLLNGDLQLYSEMLGAGDELRWDGTYDQPNQIYNKSILVNNDWIASTWQHAYNAINICNNIIASIGNVDEKDRDRVKGEALFIRGEMYFELVTYFSQPYSAGNTTTNLGVQLVTAPTLGGVNNSDFVPRSTVEQTFDLIVSDLAQAASLLPEDYNPNKEKNIHANKFCAEAVLSRVYLQMGDYEKARDEANDIIENGGYSLTSSYAAEFNNDNNTTEDIFDVQVSEQDAGNDLFLFWSITKYGARSGDVAVLQPQVDLYEAGDARGNFFYQGNGELRTEKWQLNFKNIPLIRLAEMYLTRAECNFRLGTTVGATPFEDIQTIRSRAGLNTDPSYVTLDNIILERHRELVDEGLHIQDIKRLMQSTDGHSFDANELVFPIPINEINAVGADILKQNPGY